MKMRKFYYLLAVCTLFILPFTSCNDDDDELLTPAGGVFNLSFTDEDIAEGKIGGTLKWTLPEEEINIDNYVIYQGDDAASKTIKLAEVAKGTTSFDIPNGTDHKEYILVVAKNATGESTNVVSIAVNDNTGPVVLNAEFADTDLSFNKIGGTLSWELPTSEDGITGYVIYASDATDKKEEIRLGEVKKGDTSFNIPAGTDYKPYLLIISKNEDGESKNRANVAVIDAITPYENGLFILNCGNEKDNNASLSFYEFATGKMTTDIYKTRNGSGLGDSAEKILIYGSKIYITVAMSNRIVVLDMAGKLIKSFEPKTTDGEPVNPRGMVAGNGKVYVSYFYGHSVAALDTASLEIEKEVTVGRNPEQLTLANGKIYVANSGGLDFATGYDKTVSVIDLESFTEEKKIEVLVNPSEIVADSEGDVYVISMGDYGDIKNTLQRIDGETGEVTVIDKATTMTLVNDQLYTIYGQWGEPEAKFIKYDTKTDQVVSNNFVTGKSFSTSTTLRVAVDPHTGKIYITDAPWGATTTLSIFGADGKFEKDTDTGGYYAKSMAFLPK